MAHIKKTYESFINEELDTKKSFEIDRIKDIVRNVNAELVHESPNLLLVRVGDFTAAKRLGTPSWELCHKETYWNQYVNDFINVYFIYDFTKNPSDKEALFSAMISPSGKVTSAYYQDNSAVDVEYIDSLTDLMD